MQKCDLCDDKALVIIYERDYLCAKCWTKHNTKPKQKEDKK